MKTLLSAAKTISIATVVSLALSVTASAANPKFGYLPKEQAPRTHATEQRLEEKTTPVVMPKVEILENGQFCRLAAYPTHKSHIFKKVRVC